MRIHEPIERSHKKLYRLLKTELEVFERTKNRDIEKYERTYNQKFPKTFRTSSKKQLFQKIAKSKIVLIGDFHSFRQSQKGFIRLLEETLKLGKKPTIALECLQQSSQRFIDLFLDGLITLDELREESHFEKNWPFPWKNYREILLLAKEKNLPVFGINIPEKKRESEMLRKRDIAAAEKISAIAQTLETDLFFVLYGDLHLASPHLPNDLSKFFPSENNILVIHQNEPSLYWRLPKDKNGRRPEIIRLDKNQFCLMNAVPWVRLRSYLDWLEGNPEGDLVTPENYSSFDIVHNYAEILAETLGFKTELRSDFEIFGPDRVNNTEVKKMTKESKLVLRHSVTFQRTGYASSSGYIFLPIITINSLSESGSYLLWRSQADINVNCHDRNQLIIQFLIGYLGSKIINPKRKCNEVSDLLLYVEKNNRSKITRIKRQRQIYQSALYYLHPILDGKKLVFRLGKNLPLDEMEACRLAGYILGERIFSAVFGTPEGLSIIQKLFRYKGPTDTEGIFLKIKTLLKRAKTQSISKHDLF